jgi:hypothetical protein
MTSRKNTAMSYVLSDAKIWGTKIWGTNTLYQFKIVVFVALFFVLDVAKKVIDWGGKENQNIIDCISGMYAPSCTID